MVGSVALTFFFSTALCGLVLLTKQWHLNYTAKGHTSQTKQSSHRIPTPRIGGLGLLAFAIAAPLMMDAETSYIAILLAASAIPVFLGGFGEDTGFDVSPKTRLVLSFVSAATAGVLLGVWVERTGIPFIDSALSIAFVSYLFTMLIAGAICHATNLVDGLNGLSLGLSLMMTVALTIIAFAVGDIVMAQICLLLVGALGGVFIFNFPLGKIFLGDAGAYTIGHMLTWIAILLLSRNDEIAPFSMFLVFFWPLADMLFAILRRIRNGKTD